MEKWGPFCCSNSSACASLTVVLLCMGLRSLQRGSSRERENEIERERDVVKEKNTARGLVGSCHLNLYISIHLSHIVIPKYKNKLKESMYVGRNNY